MGKFVKALHQGGSTSREECAKWPKLCPVQVVPGNLKQLKEEICTFPTTTTLKQEFGNAPQCAKQTSSYSSYLNHQKWHRGYNSKVRQIKAREKHREQAQLKAYAKLLERRKPKSPRQGDPDYVNPAAKSAPAKIHHSPRIQREKEKSKGKKKDPKGKE